MKGVIELSYYDLLIASVLVLLTGCLSVALKLGLEKTIAIASLRTVVQLLLIGFILEWLFSLNSFLALIPVVFVMVAVATSESVKRSSRYFKGIHRQSFLSLFIVGLTVVYVVTAVIVKVEPWWKPQYLIPLLGMIVGNILTGISLTIDNLLESFAERRHEIEMELSLGATSWEASRDSVSAAVRKGLIPVINSMMVVGLVSLPGMMTGQILSGTSPVMAVKYQIVVMFMIAAAVSLGSIGMALLIFRKIFNDKHQLMTELILKRAKKAKK